MITVLTRNQFLATFVLPMRSLDAGEFVATLPIGECAGECLRALRLQVERERLEPQYVYENRDRSFIHVLIYFGEPNVYMAIVVAGGSKLIHGCFLLDLNKEYGLE